MNLIGEHTDYSNLPVLPIAMERATRIAAAPTDDGRLVARSLRFEGEADLDRAALDRAPAAPWHRYIVGALRLLQGAAPGRGARLLVSGDLPTTGGLSSSSSFTVGLLAALDRIWDLGRGLAQLVELAIVAERHVGVESGGMDQTVIAHAEQGAALRIDFAPTRTRAVPLPEELRIVVAYSGEEAPKGGAVRQAYNERVIGCRLSAALLAARLGLSPGSPPGLGEVAGAARRADIEALPDRMSARQVARELGIDVDPLVRLTAARFDPDLAVALRAVARHVLSEARRVDEAEAALVAGELEPFGRLLDASHASLSQDFGCSTPALDRLCRVMREAGALGARLTGAGFGGYALAATRPEALEPVLGAARGAVEGPVFETRAGAGLSYQSTVTG